MRKVYDWGIFWENGEKVSMPVPFGPEDPAEDRMITTLDCEWVRRLTELYPKLPAAMDEVEDEWNFAFILVNPPREATVEEVEHFKTRGFMYEDW